MKFSLLVTSILLPFVAASTIAVPSGSEDDSRGGRMLHSKSEKNGDTGRAKQNSKCPGPCNDGFVYWKYVDLRYFYHKWYKEDHDHSPRHRDLRDGRPGPDSREGSNSKESDEDSWSYSGDYGSGETIPWNVALEATPPGCVLAPVKRPSDLLEIRAAIPAYAILGDGSYHSYNDALNAWIGVVKPAPDDDNDGRRRRVYYEGYMNLDGSNVPSTRAFWGDDEPDNYAPGQTRVHYWYEEEGLRNLRNDGGDSDGTDVFAAVYKCCFDLCVEPVFFERYHDHDDYKLYI